MLLRIGSYLTSGLGLSSVRQTVSRSWRYYTCCFLQKLRTHQGILSTFCLEHMLRFSQSLPTTGLKTNEIQNMTKKYNKDYVRGTGNKGLTQV
jgi:hypothetical protein